MRDILNELIDVAEPLEKRVQWYLSHGMKRSDAIKYAKEEIADEKLKFDADIKKRLQIEQTQRQKIRNKRLRDNQDVSDLTKRMRNL